MAWRGVYKIERNGAVVLLLHLLLQLLKLGIGHSTAIPAHACDITHC